MSHDPSAVRPSRLDDALDRACATSAAPGAQAAVLREGEPVWIGASGLADVATGTPVTGDTVFCLASLGKTPVAALALRLVDQGRLDLDAPIAHVVPEVPGASVVTARMLLTHTAGYPDVYESPELAALMPSAGLVEGGGAAYDPDRPFTWEMLLPGFGEPVDPGRRWEYSNGGYILLTEMLVRLHGGAAGLAGAWAALAADAAAGRLTDDVLTLDRGRVPIDRLAHGYDEQPDGTLVDAYADHPATAVPTDLFGLPFGDGLFAGTAPGIAAFLDALFVRGTVLRPATVELMTTTTPQAAAAVDEVHDPGLTTYGMGTFRMEGGGVVWHGHRGSYGGFTVVGMSDRARGLTLTVLTNADARDKPAVGIWSALARALH